jgi:hypothetical protein
LPATTAVVAPAVCAESAIARALLFAFSFLSAASAAIVRDAASKVATPRVDRDLLTIVTSFTAGIGDPQAKVEEVAEPVKEFPH